MSLLASHAIDRNDFPPTADPSASMPAERFGLSVRARVTIGDVEWVLYDDGVHLDATRLDDFDVETEESDYSLWCAQTTTADRPTLVEILDAAGIDYANSGAHGSITLYSGRPWTLTVYNADGAEVKPPASTPLRRPDVAADVEEVCVPGDPSIPGQQGMAFLWTR